MPGRSQRPENRVSLIRFATLLCLGASLLLSATGCEQGPSDEELAQAQQLAEARRQMEEKERAEEAARKQAEEEAAAAEAAKKAALAAKKAAGVLSDCCTALGKAAFEGRSMTYQKAADLCEAAKEEEGKLLADILPQLKQALTADEDEKEPLPEECGGTAPAPAP